MDQLFTADNILKVILFIAGYVIAAIRSYWLNRKGRWILVEKIAENFVFSKPSTMTNESGFEIRVYDRPIQSLVQTQLRVSNTGADIAEPIKIRLYFKKQKSGESIEVFGVKATGDGYTWYPLDILTLERPYFNSSRAYRNVLNVFLYSEYPLTVHVEGSGVGWQSKYIDQVQRQTRIKQVLIDSILANIGLTKLKVNNSPIRESVEGEEKWVAGG